MATLTKEDIIGLENQTGMADFAKTLVDVKEGASTYGVFDSTEINHTIDSEAPEVLKNILQAAPKTGIGGNSGQATLLSAVYDGIKGYEEKHGCMPRGDILENAVRNGLVVLDNAARKVISGAAVYDDASSTASGAPMQVNRAAVAIYQAIAENAIPFAGYLPMNQGLEGRIIIMEHTAGSTCGAYKETESMDGVNIGKNYMSSARYVVLTDNAGTWEGFIPYAEGDTSGVPIIPSATEILVDGEPLSNKPDYSENVPESFRISGTVEINGTEYAASGTGNSKTGVIKVSFSPNLPVGVEVEALGHINYEHTEMKDKRPRFEVKAQSRSFRATYMSGYYRTTQEAKLQFGLETQTDSGSQAMVALRSQAGVETLCELLPRMYKLAKKYEETVDLKTSTRLDERGMESIWADVLYKLTEIDVDMAVRTHGVGIKYIYVSRKGMANMMALSRSSKYFEAAPNLEVNAMGHVRVGRLFGKWDVYFRNGCVNETATSLEMMLIGGSAQSALNPAIIGEAAGATAIALGVGNELAEGVGYFQARAAGVNKFKRSRQAVALLNVIDLQ